ncbi:PREDICTED: uncharacterized protein LOC109479893 [Branchiostoma belcheri]|uniref:Uncharacterized protein LOC109479893 n=1 Tax=Branchiostoma belcheri TaxID=7741 RepID=A0A6P4ZTS5_BRABE|nr:PREDICTED: uncharacterized protein LOC109479893 [Branchiostoma belcheri]XP_019637504.1 PREDICTED: uncharacterized protein LOC109479893 [Branchiostoma belcheri]
MSLLPYNTKRCYLVHRRRGRTFYLSPGKRGDKVTAKRTAAAVLLHTYRSTETEVEVMLEFGNGAAVAANFHQPHLPLTLTRDVDEVDGAAPPPACLFNLEPAWGNMYRLRSSQDTSYYVTIRQNVAVLCKRDDPNVRERDQMFRIYDP